jgi:hypothetical protein
VERPTRSRSPWPRPHRVTRLALLNPLAPVPAVARIRDRQRRGRIGAAVERWFVEHTDGWAVAHGRMAGLFRTDPQAFLERHARMHPADTEQLTRADARQAVGAEMEEMFRQGLDGLVDDTLIAMRPGWPTLAAFAP